MKRLENCVDWEQGDWDSFFVQKGTQWRNKDYRYLHDIFDLRNILNGSLLDVGCGLGDGLLYLKKKCPKVDRLIGIDISEKAVEINRNNSALSGMEFFHHDILKPLSEKYDNIICLSTVEHLEDPQTAMQNLIDSAKEVLIVGVPYHNRRPDENHLWYFDESDFSNLTDLFSFDRKGRMIYWLFDKQERGISFYGKRSHSLSNFIAKLFRPFS